MSHLTLNIAFGSASWTTPSNSSLSPFGSLRSLRSLTCLNRSFSLLPLISERGEYCFRHLGHALRSVDAPDDSLFFVMRNNRRSRVRISQKAFANHVLLIVGSMFEIGVRGRGVILQVVNLSSAFVRSTKHCAF